MSILEVAVRYDKDQELNYLAEAVFKAKATHGLPPDIALDKLRTKGYSEEKLFYILSRLLGKLIEHKRLAGATEDNLGKARSRNVRIMERFERTGEVML